MSSYTINPSVYQGANSNLWRAPGSPHAQDDEFDSSTLDSSWKIYEAFSPINVGSVSYGTINAYDTSFTTGTVLRVDVDTSRPSWFMMQQPAGSGSTTFFRITKSYTLPTNMLIWARMKFNHYTVAAANDDFTIGLTVNHDDGTGKPDPLNSAEFFLNESDSGAVRARWWKRVSGSTTVVGTATDVDAQGQALEYIALQKRGTTFHGWAGTNQGSWIWLGASTVNGTFAHVGFFVSQFTGVRPGALISGVDFIRFQETDNFLL